MPYHNEVRQRALERYAVPDAGLEETFDRLVGLAAQMLGVPVAVLGFLEGERCRLDAETGLEAEAVPAASSFIAQVVEAGEGRVFHDPEALFSEGTTADRAEAPRVYAGVPLVVEMPRPVRTPVAIGALCVLGDALAMPDAEALEVLEALATTAVEGMTLRERDRSFQLLFERNPDPMWVYDRETLRFLAVNEAAVAHYGYTHDEFLSMHITDIPPADEVDELVDYLEHTPSSFRHSGHWRHQRADGSVIDVDVTSSDLEFEGRAAALVVARDVTEQRAAQAALREREHYLSVTLDSIGDAVITTDVEGRVTGMNPVAERLTGWTEAEATGRPLVEVFRIVNAHTGATVESPVTKVLRNGHVVGLANHTVLIARDETRYQIADSAAPIQVEDGETLGVVMVFRDVTEAYERREALRRNQNLLSLALRVAQAGVWEWSPEAGMMTWSDENYRVFGLTPGDGAASYERWRERVHPDDREAAEQAVAEALEDREALDIEYRIVRPDGAVRWINARGRMHAGEEGRSERLIGFQIDITEQKKQMSLVRRLGRVLDASVNEIYLFEDPSLRFVQVSKGGQENLGYTMDELRAMTPLDLKPFDREHFEELIQPIRAGTQEQIVFETTHRRKDGSTYPVEVRLQRARHEAPPVFIAIVLDITDRKEAEEALRQSEERYRTLVERSHDAIFIYRGNRLLFVNERTCTLTGYAEDELLGMDVFELLHPDDRARVQRIARERAEGAAPSRYEARLLRPDGTVRYGAFSVQAITYQDEYAAIGSIRDVTERRMFERTLRRRENKVQALYEAMGALTLTQTSVLVAERLQALIIDTLGYRISGVRYLEGDMLVPVVVSEQARRYMPDRPEYHVDGPSAVAEAFREGEAVLYDDVRTTEVQAPGAVRAAAYVPLGAYGILAVGSTEVGGIDPFDVTLIEILARNAESVLERIEREDALREARDAAKEMSRLKSAFLANMSHEIRTPLTSIIGFAEVLGEQELGEASALIHLIRRGGQRLLDTLNSVLDLSQLEAGSMELRPERIDVASEVRDTVELFTPQAREKDVALAVEGAASVAARLDAAALRRILSNLLSNAIKFTPEGGRVDVRLRATPDRVAIEVEDTGVGIDEDFLPELFEAFKQESTGNARAFEGAGLGLAITHQLVDLMQGEIEVASQKGEGTCFTVRLPRGRIGED